MRKGRAGSSEPGARGRARGEASLPQCREGGPVVVVGRGFRRCALTSREGELLLGEALDADEVGHEAGDVGADVDVGVRGLRPRGHDKSSTLQWRKRK